MSVMQVIEAQLCLDPVVPHDHLHNNQMGGVGEQDQARSGHRCAGTTPMSSRRAPGRRAARSQVRNGEAMLDSFEALD